MSPIARLAAALGLVFGLGADAAQASPIHVRAGIIAPRPAPPVPVIVRSPQPAPQAVWIAGSWGWSGITWVWSPGYWYTPAPVAHTSWHQRPLPPPTYTRVATQPVLHHNHGRGHAYGHHKGRTYAPASGRPYVTHTSNQTVWHGKHKTVVQKH